MVSLWSPRHYYRCCLRGTWAALASRVHLVSVACCGAAFVPPLGLGIIGREYGRCRFPVMVFMPEPDELELVRDGDGEGDGGGWFAWFVGVVPGSVFSAGSVGVGVGP